LAFRTQKKKTVIAWHSLLPGKEGKRIFLEGKIVQSLLGSCPGFVQDRVNFHQKPARDTARLSDRNWLNKWGIQYHVPSCSVLNGEAGQGKLITAQECAGHRVVRAAL